MRIQLKRMELNADLSVYVALGLERFELQHKLNLTSALRAFNQSDPIWALPKQRCKRYVLCVNAQPHVFNFHGERRVGRLPQHN